MAVAFSLARRRCAGRGVQDDVAAMSTAIEELKRTQVRARASGESECPPPCVHRARPLRHADDRDIAAGPGIIAWDSAPSGAAARCGRVCPRPRWEVVRSSAPPTTALARAHCHACAPPPPRACAAAVPLRVALLRLSARPVAAAAVYMYIYAIFCVCARLRASYAPPGAAPTPPAPPAAPAVGASVDGACVHARVRLMCSEATAISVYAPRFRPPPLQPPRPPPRPPPPRGSRRPRWNHGAGRRRRRAVGQRRGCRASAWGRCPGSTPRRCT